VNNMPTIRPIIMGESFGLSGGAGETSAGGGRGSMVGFID
jgi:hypothetical protein